MAVDIDELANLVGLQIPEAHREHAAAQYAALLLQAELVLSFPLEDEIEPAPVFIP
jgi:hypothetical protein